MSPRRTLTRTLLALCCALTALGGAVTTAPPAAGQVGVAGTAEIRLLSQSPWIAARDTFSFTLEVDTDRPGTIDVVVEDALGDPGAVAADPGRGPTIVRSLPSVPVVAGRQVLRIDTPVVPTADGTPGNPLVLADGVFPVQVILRDDTGRRTTLRTHLVHVDPEPVRPLVLVVPVAPALSRDGTVTPQARDALRSALDVLRSAGDVPLALHVRPDLLDGLAADTVSGSAVRTALVDLVRGGDAILGAPYVPLDEASWHGVGASDVVGWARNEGATVLEDAGIVADTEMWRLVGPGTEQTFVHSAGAGAGVLLVDAATLPGAGWHVGGVTFAGSGTLRVIPVTAASAAGPLVGDPVLAAHRTLAALAVAGGGQLLLPDLPTTAAELADWTVYVRTLLSPLARTDRPFTPITDLRGDALPVVEAAAAGIEAATPPDPPTVDVSRARAALAVAAHVAGALALDPGPAERGRRDALRALTLEPAAASALLEETEARLRALVRDIDLPARETVVVTSYRAEFPVVIHNRSERPLRVRVQISGPGVEVDETGTFDVDVPPGVVEVLVPVQTRRSGTFRLLVRVSTPDGGIELARTTVDLRSQTISGVGVALSVGAIAVLAAWWIRSDRRRRSALAAAAAGTGSTEP